MAGRVLIRAWRRLRKFSTRAGILSEAALHHLLQSTKNFELHAGEGVEFLLRVAENVSESGGALRIIHLSDIHFRKTEIVTVQDPNHHLRSELIRDIRTITTASGPADIVVVSGDIAFGGEPEEFTFATTWLREVCAACGASTSSVFVVPGNHDALRKIADKPMVQLLHKAIKDASDLNSDITVRGFLADKETARPLYESLDNYNAFAQQYLCDLLPPERTRATRDLELNDGSTLRLWGLNTAFVSSSADKEGDLFVDTASLQITKDSGVTNMVIAHHHLSWLRHKQALEDHLNDVAPIQVFGHVHTNRIIMSRDWIRLTASAAHPDRREAGWEPGYNVVDLTINNANGQRELNVTTHVRVWQGAPGEFRPKMDKGRDVFYHTIVLENWEAADDSSEIVAPSEASSLTSPDVSVPEPIVMTVLRDLGIKFYSLTFSQKSEIAGRLKLLEEEDIGQPDFERFRRVFFRAHERGILEQLKEAVENIDSGKGG